MGKVLRRPVSYGALDRKKGRKRMEEMENRDKKSHRRLPLPGTRDGWTPEEQNNTVGGSATKPCQVIWGLRSGGRGCGDSKDMLPPCCFSSF